ncbi:MAG: 1-acyl-sn-glycerol-3-phosphate acyltransferase [Bacteroidales bacterium]|nr:1-acyl-sn-glycerol-3-phosphate acyltransferase [Bacteroidales bacterium]
MYKIAHLILVRMLGWKITSSVSSPIDKSVIIVAPHTSLWDFVIGRLAFWVMKQDVKFMINGKYFFWPLGALLKALGGVPVKYDRTTGLLMQINQMYQRNDTFNLVITPEGTRALAVKWKKGFYQIATTAEVPVYMAFIDYKEKRGGIGPKLDPSGDYEKDLHLLEKFYGNFHAKHPEKYNLNPD